MKLLTKKEVCAELQVCSQTVDKMHKLGLLPRIQITPKTIRYREEDLHRFIERRKLD